MIDPDFSKESSSRPASLLWILFLAFDKRGSRYPGQSASELIREFLVVNRGVV